MLRPLLLILGSLLSGALARPLLAAGEQLPVWKLRSASAEVVLLGSMHMAYPDIYPLRAAIERAFRAADTLVVEVDISGDGGARLRQLVRERGRLPAGDRLQQHLAPATWQRLDDYLRGRGLAVESLLALRPGLAAVSLVNMRLLELGMRPELGIDLHFLKQVPTTMRVLELESAEQQLELLLDFPDPSLLMDQTLAQLQQIESYLDPIVEAWRSGDAGRLNRLLREEEQARHPEFEPVYRTLFDERNAAMASQIEAFLGGRGRYFVVVGAGHLVGPGGIVSLLEQRGFSTERL